MATYLMTFRFTQQGAQDAKNIKVRVEAAKKTVKSLGGKTKAFYGILGAEFDTMILLEAPDEESVAAMALSISSLGNVSTSTHRAFSEEEFWKILSAMP